MSSPWHTGFENVKRLSAELLSSNEPFPPEIDGQIWEEAAGAAAAQDFGWYLIGNSWHVKLAHKICYDISDISMIDGRPFEEWEFKLINALLAIFQLEWTTWRSSIFSRRSEQAYHGDLRVSLSNLMRYLELWTPRECKRLSHEAIGALYDLERICQTDETENLMVGVPLRSFLAKVTGGCSSYTKKLEPAAAENVISLLREASDANTSCECLFEIAAISQHSDGLKSMVQNGAPDALNDFMVRFARDPKQFKSSLPPAVLLNGTKETATVPNALRKCCVSLASSERSVKALARANILEGIAAVVELYARTHLFEQIQLGLATMYCGKDEFLVSVCLSVACMVFPYTPDSLKAIVSKIMAGANDVVTNAGNEESHACKDTTKYASALSAQVAMCAHPSRKGVKVSKSIAKAARETLQSLHDKLPKACSGPTCQQDEGPGTKFQVCSGCRIAAYCSKQCQKAHWKAGHKHECAARVAACAKDRSFVD